MGNLYAALANAPPLALLLSSIVFQFNVFMQYGAGVTVSRPSFGRVRHFADLPHARDFVVISLFIAAIRRSTSGLALSAIRSTEDRRSRRDKCRPLQKSRYGRLPRRSRNSGGMYVIYAGVARRSHLTPSSG